MCATTSGIHASIVEPWDGPAGLIFTDGRRVGATLDRNGLRPMRWQRSDDGVVVCCSEAGVVPLTGRGRITRGRLGPGEMLCVDPDAPVGFGPLQDDGMVKTLLAARAPYGDWARDGLLPFDCGGPVEMPPAPDELVAEQVAFGCNREEVAMVLKPMATDAKEPTFSMGDDTPFAAVATRPRPMFNYLKQRFAQVSNPPIDHLRERLVMSTADVSRPSSPASHGRPGGGAASRARHLLPVPGGRQDAPRLRPIAVHVAARSTRRSRSPMVRRASHDAIDRDRRRRA